MTGLDAKALAAISAGALTHHTRPSVPYCTSCVDDIAQLCDAISRVVALLDKRTAGDYRFVLMDDVRAELETKGEGPHA